MDGLFKLLWDRVDTNARRAVDVYTSELEDFRAVAQEQRAKASMLDFAVLLRRREVELAADGASFTGKDLAILGQFGEERGSQGISLSSRRRVLDLHDVLTLREIHEAAGFNETHHVTEMIGWLAANGLAGQSAYAQGFLKGQKRSLPIVKRVQDLAVTLLSDVSVVPGFAESLNMRVADRYVIMVVRMSGTPLPASKEREKVIGALLESYAVPMMWREPDELVALIPCTDSEAAEERALGLARELATLVGRPCAPGAATGRVHALGDTVALARQISQVAPVEAVPRRLHLLADAFVELGVVQVPQVDEWLHGLAQRLENGPDLVATLDAFYRHDMNRLNTAGALHIHPRTLDYRFRRVRELVGMDPGSLQGVRVLSAVVARVLAGRWH
ncbi:helix-turn-helix domain-containing protein [Kibdelosporangium philippinense]|uniref:Helix-turn-helix domain-containing protein n=1 Tax=Kibdelosporangium philippinense TaxID=211113 RepID=A0ABS8Z5N6_9PSEU|nr:helix-turn-helix domain-containing protein [Kibdelosporangium philippinense]MCE7003201.1 helix-turn-helix domain-containing protein [Kibdelosporangium philippinense]